MIQAILYLAKAQSPQLAQPAAVTGIRKNETKTKIQRMALAHTYYIIYRRITSAGGVFSRIVKIRDIPAQKEVS
ncbi:MAG: hypothetical protein GY696_36355, partial [Gammaproteobacteria bacterium]|nr:hypothetical protein [Gammaproteobacteria bacterium]